jgi:hypothetical protein
MKVYGLYDESGDTICEVEIESKPWFPVKPRISRQWLRLFIVEGLRRYFDEAACVVKA